MKRDSLKKGGDSMYLRRKASPNYKTISQGKKEHGIKVTVSKFDCLD